MYKMLTLMLLSVLVIVGCESENTTAPVVDESTARTDNTELAQEPEGISAEDEISGEVLASVTLPDGSKLTFRHQDGVIAATAAMSSDMDSDAYRLLESDLTPVELFQECANKKEVPIALQQRWDEVSAAMAAGFTADDEQQDIESVEPEGLLYESPELDKSWSGSYFSSNYCGSSGWDWSWCYTNRSGNGYVQKSGASFSCEYFYSIYGHIKLKQSYKVLGVWVSAGSTWLSGGDLVYGYLRTWPKTTHRLQIQRASGNDWHMAFKGDT